MVVPFVPGNAVASQEPGTPKPGDKIHLALSGVAEAGDDGFFTGVPFSKSYSHTVMTFGNMKGSIMGAHKIQSLMLHSPEFQFPILRGKAELASPNYVLGPNSKYYLIFDGIMESCCSENFRMSGKFETCKATGRFAGTRIVGTWVATGDFGFDNHIVLTGEVTEDDGTKLVPCSLTEMHQN
jgi:hypothetical protein